MAWKSPGIVAFERAKSSDRAADSNAIFAPGLEANFMKKAQ
jgi:hypothetical protein